MKIVQFITGEYAVRKFSWCILSYVFADLKSGEFWWRTGSIFFKDCLTTDLEEARDFCKYRNGKVVE